MVRRWLCAAALCVSCGSESPPPSGADGGSEDASMSQDVPGGDVAAQDAPMGDVGDAPTTPDLSGGDGAGGADSAADATMADATTADAITVDVSAPDTGEVAVDIAEPPIPDECWDDLAVGEGQVFHEAFDGGVEGIAFGPGSALYVSQQKTGQIWRIQADGTAEPFAIIPRALGLAPAPDGGLLVADLGESTKVDVLDGALWHVDPAGVVTKVSDPMASPNFVVSTPDGATLVSDDFDTRVFLVAPGGAVTVALDDIGSPNGLGYSPDGAALYVASTFTADGEVTRVPVGADGLPSGAPRQVIATLGGTALPDGLAVDEHDRVYVAANFAGQIVRVRGDGLGGPTVLNGDVKNPASLAFGAADGFDPCSLYVTELFQGRLWRVAVGARGVPLP